MNADFYTEIAFFTELDVVSLFNTETSILFKSYIQAYLCNKTQPYNHVNSLTPTLQKREVVSANIKCKIYYH